MLFNSWGYLLFLAVCVASYWLLPKRSQRIYLVSLASLAFYAMWRWEFALLVLFSAWVDFTVAKKIYKEEDRKTRRRWLVCSLVINLGLLFFFKYTYFVYDNISLITASANQELPALESLGVRIILPLGISFYTFQTISYSIDIYRKSLAPVSNFALFCAYVMFWPQLIAGPILRASEVIPELTADRQFSWDDMAVGLRRILTGLCKKVVLADTLALVVDPIFAQDISYFTAIDVWAAAILFGFQIYFDFSGYSDVAIGSARLLGIRFPENFDWPYLAKSPKDFWGRWHISLGSWIRDYLYLPLTGQKFQTKSQGGLGKIDGGRRKTDRALLLTWIIMGFWHGAAWNFAIWGIYHAAWILIYRRVTFLGKMPNRFPKLATIIMLGISMAGWIPFRASSVGDSLSLFSKLLNPLAYTLSNHRVTIYAYALVLVLLTATFAVQWVQRKDRLHQGNFGLCGRVAVQAFMITGILIGLERIQTFIYFQF